MNTSTIRGAALALVLVCGAATALDAQSRTGPSRSRSFQASVGALFLSGTDFGAASATLTNNQVPPTRYTLFQADSTLQPTPGLEARLGYMLTRTFGIEGALLYSRPRLETRLSADVEGATPLTATNELSQYMLDVSAVLHLPRLRFGGAMPFVLGGAGYLRQLDEDRALVETGQTVHAGGGLTYVFRQRTRGLVRGLGVRADGRLYVRTGGYELNDEISRRAFGTGGARFIVFF
jgi:hypothetical protein